MKLIVDLYNWFTAKRVARHVPQQLSDTVSTERFQKMRRKQDSGIEAKYLDKDRFFKIK